MAIIDLPLEIQKETLNEISEYDIDENYNKSIKSLYSQALDIRGLNIKDPIETNMRFFNKAHSLELVDPPFVGKTYIFMTRPMLNLFDTFNLKQVGFFEYCMSFKLGRLCLLQLQHERAQFLPLKRFGLDSKYNDIDELKLFTCFMPMISNFCIDSSGAKDLTMETKETESDYSGNKLVYATGADETWTTGEITLNFKDAKYNPILLLHYIWFMYIHYCCKGDIIARVEHIINKIIDYSTSIFIFLTDESQSNIVRWVRYMGCFPKTVPFGQIQHKIDLDPMSLRDFSMTYAYNRYEVNDINSIIDFNTISYEYVFNMNKDDPDSLIENYRSKNFLTGSNKYGDDEFHAKNRADVYSDIAYNGGNIKEDPSTTFDKQYGVPKHFLNDLKVSGFRTIDNSNTPLKYIPDKFIEDPLKGDTNNFYNEQGRNIMEEYNRKLEESRNQLDLLVHDKIKAKDPSKEYSSIYKRHPYIYNNSLIWV